MLPCRPSGFSYTSLTFHFLCFMTCPLLLCRSSFTFPGLPWHFSQGYLCFICYSAVRTSWFPHLSPETLSILSSTSFHLLVSSPQGHLSLYFPLIGLFSVIGCLVHYLHSLIFHGYILVSPLCVNRWKLILSIYSLN